MLLKSLVLEIFDDTLEVWLSWLADKLPIEVLETLGVATADSVELVPRELPGDDETLELSVDEETCETAVCEDAVEADVEVVCREVDSWTVLDATALDVIPLDDCTELDVTELD